MSLSVELDKKLGDFHLQVAFDNPEGILGILGGSGMGKSMTLKMIAGLVKPDAGRIIVNGRTVYDSAAGIDVPARDRHIGYLFQQYALFPTMTVAENIAVAMKEKGSMRQKKIENFLEQFSLQGMGGRMPSELSGGQQQRVALARMLAGRPGMLLLDEPFSALDSFLKEQLLEDMLCQLSGYEGDVVMVSHSRDEIYQFCSQLLVLDEGKVRAFGNTKQIFACPGSVEAARLTGCKNIIEAMRLSNYCVYVPDWHCELHFNEKVPEGLRAIGIRAHYIEVLREAPEDRTNVVDTVVESISELPFEWYCFFRVPGGGRIWWKTAKNGLDTDEKRYLPVKDEKVYLRFPPESVLLLV